MYIHNGELIPVPNHQSCYDFRSCNQLLLFKGETIYLDKPPSAMSQHFTVPSLPWLQNTHITFSTHNIIEKQKTKTSKLKPDNFVASNQRTTSNRYNSMCSTMCPTLANQNQNHRN